MTDSNLTALPNAIPASTAFRFHGVLTALVALLAMASAWAIPFSPFSLLLSTYWYRRTSGWERNVTVAAVTLCALSALVFVVIVLSTSVGLLAGWI